jgi:hypothetical protein
MVPSNGVRIRGRVTGRVHHLLSRLEEACFRLVDWSDEVLDIREQYALWPLEETQAIAVDLGVRHPRHPRTREPIVMTTDFLVTVRGTFRPSLVAIACKPADRLGEQRVLEKLEIERRYWASRGVSWRIVTERDVAPDVVAGLKWVAGNGAFQDLGVPAALVPRLTDEVLRRVQAASGVPLNLACLSIDDRLGLALGTSLTLVRHALARRWWHVDWSGGVHPCRPLVGLRPCSGKSDQYHDRYDDR